MLFCVTFLLHVPSHGTEAKLIVIMYSGGSIIIIVAVVGMMVARAAQIEHHESSWGDLSSSEKIYMPIAAAVLVMLGGIFSGLTLALFSIDIMYLRVAERTGEVRERQAAARILPLAMRHHLTLVTLLVSNAAVMTALPVLLEEMVDAATALIISVTALLFFGEVLPQATFVRHALPVCKFFAPLIWFCIGLTFIVSYPASKVLDCIVGHKSEVLERDTLVEFFKQQGKGGLTSDRGLSAAEVNTINGALHLTQKKVKELMKVPAAKVFMLPSSTQLNEATVQEILLKGFSRIPVYSELDRSHILGVLLAKSLLRMAFTNLENPPMCGDYHLRELLRVSEDAIVEDLYIAFQNGQSHMAAVYNRQGLFSGIVTLEDIFEELHSVSIPDEFDRAQTKATTQIDIREEQRKRNEMGSVSDARDVQSARRQKMLAVYGSVRQHLAADPSNDLRGSSGDFSSTNPSFGAAMQSSRGSKPASGGSKPPSSGGTAPAPILATQPPPQPAGNLQGKLLADRAGSEFQ